MLRAIVCASILALLAASSGAREPTSFRAAQSADAKKTSAAEERRKIVDELRLKYQAAVAELGKNNTGAATRAKQKDIADLLDELLKQESDPPPSSNPPAADPPPAGNENPPPLPKPLNPEPNKAHEDAPAPPRNESAETKKSQGAPERVPMNLNDVQKQSQGEPWRPKLPARAGQDIDAYARERFMHRYEDVLRAYYRTLAESSRRKDGD